jgi:MptA/FolE2 family GTP cyclohydrolase
MALPDAQAQFDARGIEIDEVGVDRLSYPITYRDLRGTSQSSVAEVEFVASLDADVRGTHMSRFVEALHAHRDGVTPATPVVVAQELRRRLGARRAAVELRFTLFIEREAPVTGAAAFMGYGCRLWGSVAEGEPDRARVGVSVPVTSLCPCSKEISDYGAHSQRGYVEFSVEPEPNDRPVWPEELIAVASAAGSAPVYPLLKRADEREVTMLAYDNPAFVEDVARDVAAALTADERVRAFDVQVANEESIHDHRAIARVRWRRSDA